VLNSSGDRAGATPLFGEAFAAAAQAGFEFLAIDALHMLAIAAPADAQEALNGEALKLADTARDPRARQWRASLLNNMGWTAFERGDFDAALDRFESALAARREQDQPAEIQIARWCVARTLRALGRLDEALDIQLALAAEHEMAGTADPFVDEEITALKAEAAEGGIGEHA
jgi:tetratricopeptide (TPR) repeat protein